jgi:hypothetical protein
MPEIKATTVTKTILVVLFGHVILLILPRIPVSEQMHTNESDAFQSKINFKFWCACYPAQADGEVVGASPHLHFRFYLYCR